MTKPRQGQRGMERGMADESTCKKLNIPEVVVTPGRLKPGAPRQARLVTASQNTDITPEYS